MIRETFRCNTGIIFDAAMLQQIGMSLYVDPLSGRVDVCREVPTRIRGDDDSYPADSNELEQQQTQGGLARFCKATLGWILWPLSPVFILIPGRKAVRGWISDTARAEENKKGRGVVPGRTRADRVKGHSQRHPHAVDVGKTVLFDPEYEAREERKDAVSPLFDQLGAGSGECFFGLLVGLVLSVS